MNYLKDNLRVLRKYIGMTQGKAASESGLGQTTWSNYENGVSQPGIEEMIIISKIFDISLDALLLFDLSKYDLSAFLKNEKHGLHDINKQLPGKPSDSKKPKTQDLPPITLPDAKPSEAKGAYDIVHTGDNPSDSKNNDLLNITPNNSGNKSIAAEHQNEYTPGNTLPVRRLLSMLADHIETLENEVEILKKRAKK